MSDPALAEIRPERLILRPIAVRDVAGPAVELDALGV